MWMLVGKFPHRFLGEDFFDSVHEVIVAVGTKCLFFGQRVPFCGHVKVNVMWRERLNSR